MKSEAYVLNKVIKWNYWFCCWFFFLFIYSQSFSQNLEAVFSRGYNSHVSHFDRFSDGRWLLAVKDSPIPGGIYMDTLSLRIVDSTGALIKLITLSPPRAFENFSIDHLLILPQDQFMVGYSGGDCDAGGAANFIEKFDSLGQSLWSIQLEEYLRPEHFGIGIDSNILMLSGYEIVKISTDSGSFLWRTEYSDSYLYYMVLVPGSEDIIASDEDGLKYYEQHSIQGNISYSLTAAEEIPQDFGSIGLFQATENGVFYAYKFYDKQIIRFRKDLKAKIFLTTPGSFLEMEPMEEGLVILKNKDVNTYQVILYDSLGVKVWEHISDDTGLRPKSIKCVSTGMALAGNYCSGPNSMYDPDYHYTGRGQGWFRYFSQYDLDNVPAPVSLAVTDIIQQAPILYDSAWSVGWDHTGYVHDFIGGDFKIKVSNTGSLPVQHFWINIAFGLSVNTWFCAPFNVKQLAYDSEEIQPGESVWVEFGNIQGLSQIRLPDKFCFWSSGNNFVPDYKPQDDLFCMDRIVSTHDTYNNSFSIHPNPANSTIQITYPTPLTSTVLWNLVDVYGRKIKAIKPDNNSDQLTIEVADIPSGIYFINSENFSKTIIIQH